MGTMDAIDFLLDKLRNTKNNAEFFESMNTLCLAVNTICIGRPCAGHFI
jgi:hypothetical protein